MFGVITSKTYADDIKSAIGPKAPLFYQEGEFTEEEFILHCKSATLIDIKNFIIDMDCCTEKMSIIKGIRQIKIARPKTRVILLAVDREPGNSALSEAVGLGVYDIIAPAIPDIPEGIEDIEFDVSDIIEQQIKFPGLYPDVVRYHTVNETSNTKKVKRMKEKELKKEIVIEKKLIHVSKNNIGFINLSDDAGSSLLSLSLAAALADEGIFVSIIEFPIKPYFYQALGFKVQSDKNNNDDFYSIPHIIFNNEKVMQDKIVHHKGISWNIPNEEKEKITSWTYQDMMRQIYSSKAQLNIIDIGSLPYDEIIHELDHIFVVVDPLPQEILLNIEKLDQLLNYKNKGLDIQFIINKFNKGVDLQMIYNETSLPKAITYVPFLDVQFIYDSYFKCKIPYETESIKNDLEKPIKSILRHILPKDLVLKLDKNESKNSKTSFLSRMFNK